MMRELALLRYKEFEQELSPTLTRFAVAETIRMMDNALPLQWSQETDKSAEIERLSLGLTSKYGVWLAKNPALEDATAWPKRWPVR